VDIFVAVSDEIARELQASGVPDERIARIPNGVDTGRFHPAEADLRQALREELRLDGPESPSLWGGWSPRRDFCRCHPSSVDGLCSTPQFANLYDDPTI
jgi:glycosyltransferase involved in cell wall biosynthesis